MNPVANDDPNTAMLLLVVDALGDLLDSVVFVGGCVTNLLLTTDRAHPIRPTQDVDVIAEITSRVEFHQFEKRIEARGFQHDISDGAPICRWQKDEVTLDVMPSEPGIVGFHNHWYPIAIATANRFQITAGHSIRLISGPAFIATKIVAFLDRGGADYLASHDLEDVLTVVDGRDELIDEISKADSELRKYIAEQISKLLADPDFRTALPGHLSPDTASQARIPQLLDRLNRIAKMR